MAKKYVWLVVIMALFISFPAFAQRYEGKKILYVDSYHEGYAWSDGIVRGVKDALKGTGVKLRIFRMDTKRNKAEEFKKQAALKAKAVIEEFRPDVVIAGDDNASKYLIVPYYKGADLPFVFCGVNWDASGYGFPAKNVTGMVEVALVPQLLDHLYAYGRGRRIGFLAGDVFTQQKEAKKYKEIFNLRMNIRFVKTFEEWKKAFRDLQDEVDVLLVSNPAGIENWNNEEAAIFAEKNTKIPTGTIYEHVKQLALIGITKIPEEQGIWSVKTALSIINGISPSAIPIAKNKQGNLYLNLKIAERLGITFKPSLLKHAEIIR